MPFMDVFQKPSFIRDGSMVALYCIPLAYIVPLFIVIHYYIQGNQ